MISRLAFWLGQTASLAVLCALGCGSDRPDLVPIRGEVIYSGEPLRDVTQGIVRYTPKASGTAAREASARIQQDGSFEMTTFQKGDGVVVGEYSHYSLCLLVTSLDARANGKRSSRAAGRKLMIPEKYLEADTSGLSDQVDVDHSGFKRIELSN